MLGITLVVHSIGRDVVNGDSMVQLYGWLS